MNDMDLPDIITVDELCDILMIGKNMAYRLLNSGEIRCFKISREWKIPRKSVYEYIQRQCSKKGDENKVY